MMGRSSTAGHPAADEDEASMDWSLTLCKPGRTFHLHVFIGSLGKTLAYICNYETISIICCMLYTAITEGKLEKHVTYFTITMQCMC